MAYHRLVVLTTGGRFKPQPLVLRITSDSSLFFKQKSPSRDNCNALLLQDIKMALDQETMDNLLNLDPEQLVEVIWELQEENKSTQTNAKKGVELMNKAIELYKDTWGDLDKIAEIIESNPEAWELLLKKFYDGKTIEEIKASKEQEQELKKEESEVKLSNDRYEHYLGQIPADLQEKFKEEYDELVGKRKMTPEKVDKYVDLVIKSIRPNMSSTIEQAKLAAAWGSSVKAEAKHDVNADVEFSRELQKKLWI